MREDVEQHLQAASPHCRNPAETYQPVVGSFTQTLRYPGVMDREVSISEAHEHTLEWIFRDPESQGFQWTSFTGWLESDTSPNLYWVTGKAGSGKSTLVKHIYAHPLTKRSLQKWSPDVPAITPVFYFWNSGRPMQMSLLGLLQSLLLGVVLARPDCMPVASRSRYEAFRLFGTTLAPWTEVEAVEALTTVVEHCAKSSKLCIFIDGLDEFEGKPEKLIKLVKSLLLPNVKLCVASRPWPVFRDAFGRSPSLVLEYLNMPDIKVFVRDSLDDSAGFMELKAHDPDQADALAHEITLRSSGVFLWVSLVIQSLLEGLQRGDRLSDMRQTLQGLPTEIGRARV